MADRKRCPASYCLGTKLTCRLYVSLGKHAGFALYYEHQNNTGKKPTQQLNQLGLILNLYF